MPPANATELLAAMPHVTAAILQPVTNGNVTITLRNTHTEALYIFADFSFLTPGLEGQLMNLTNGTGTNLEINQPFQIKDIEILMPTNLTSLTELPVGQSLSRQLNLSEIFVVPDVGLYNFTWICASLEGHENNYEARGAPVGITVAAGDVNGAVAGATDIIVNCSPEDGALVEQMIVQAVEMANTALHTSDYEWLRTLYFGDTWKQTGSAYTTVLQGIASYNVSERAQPGPMFFVCDHGNTIAPCANGGFFTDTVLGFQTELSTNPPRDAIVLCKQWFDLTQYNYWFPNKIWWGEQPYDQPTLLLHEMSHAGVIAGQKTQTTDVPDKSWYSFFLGAGLSAGACYRFSCTIALASSPWDGWSPVNNAQNFAWYAKSVR